MKNTMTTTIKTITTIALLTMTIALLNLAVAAQDHQAHHQNAEVIIGKKGQVHFTQNVKVGTTVLKAGMYEVQHLVEGNNHVVVFKEVSMQAGFKHGNTPVGNEVARIKCQVEPIKKAVNNTKITLRTNAAGEKEVAEVQVAGEAFKHLL